MKLALKMAAVVAVLLLAPLLAPPREGDAAASRVCFPAANWGPAPDRLRPCVSVTRVAEDGSFTYSVSDADGVERYSAGIGAQDR